MDPYCTRMLADVMLQFEYMSAFKLTTFGNRDVDANHDDK